MIQAGDTKNEIFCRDFFFFPAEIFCREMFSALFVKTYFTDKMLHSIDSNLAFDKI